MPVSKELVSRVHDTLGEMGCGSLRGLFRLFCLFLMLIFFCDALNYFCGVLGSFFYFCCCCCCSIFTSLCALTRFSSREVFAPRDAKPGQRWTRAGPPSALRSSEDVAETRIPGGCWEIVFKLERHFRFQNTWIISIFIENLSRIQSFLEPKVKLSYDILSGLCEAKAEVAQDNTSTTPPLYEYSISYITIFDVYTIIWYNIVLAIWYDTFIW